VAQLADGSLSQRYGFIHHLYRHALYQNVPSARRAQLHRQIGRSIEKAHANQALELASELAAHFEGGRDYRRGVRYRKLAAENASRRYANAEAIAHLKGAADLLPHLPEAERAEWWAAILEQRGRVHRSMEDLRGATADRESLVEFARAAGRLDWEVKALIALSGVLFWTNHERSLAAAERAVELSSRLDNGWLHVHARGYRGSRRIRLSGWSDVDFDDCAAALEVARDSGDRELWGLHVMSHSLFLCCRSEYEAAVRAADEGLQLALEAGDAFQYISCQYFKAWALVYAGQWGGALSLIREGADLAERNGHRTGAAFFRLIEAFLRAEAGDFEGSRTLARVAMRDAREGFARYLALIVLGTANVGLGEYEDAFDCFREVWRRRESGSARIDSSYYLPLHRGLAELWLAQGDLHQAREEASRMRELAAPPGERTYLSLGKRILAEVAIARGDLTEAKEHLAGALAPLDSAAIPLAAWRVLKTAATLAERQGRSADAAGYRSRSAEALTALAQSLDEAEPLRNILLESRACAASAGGWK
jgi:hypothetical protein